MLRTEHSEAGKASGKQQADGKGKLGGLGQQLQEGEASVKGTEVGEGVWVPCVLGARSLHFQAAQPHEGLREDQFLFPKRGEQVRLQGENILFVMQKILFQCALHLGGTKTA